MYTKNDVLEFISENDVKFIRLAFCDVFGTQKNLAIQPCLLEEAFETGIPVNASLIAGFGDKTADVYLMPDPSTMAVLPWRPSTGRVVRLFCRLHTASGEPFALDARRILKNTVKSLREKELSVFFGAECEFYLFKTDENGEPTDIPLDCGGYLDLAPADRGENVRREICFTLQEMGIKPESSHHENGPGQNEIDFCAADPLTAADHVTTFKNVVQTVAQKNGLHARFDPKPLDEADGNGLHINVRVASGDAAKNKAFLAGILRRLPEMTLFLNPDESSYKRLAACACTKSIAWGYTHSDLIRIIRDDENGLLFEICSPDCLANPYLAYTLLLHAGLEGMRDELPLPECTEEDTLPESLHEAAKIALDGDFAASVLPERLIDAYAARAGIRR